MREIDLVLTTMIKGTPQVFSISPTGMNFNDLRISPPEKSIDYSKFLDEARELLLNPLCRFFNVSYLFSTSFLLY